jgi:hypothetical protein
MLSAALAYAARGWYVFPVWGVSGSACQCGGATCDRPGKHPVSQHGKDDATTDAERITAWWTQHPTANIGVAVEPSGIQVVDVDGTAGRESLTKLGSLPVTMTARTGSGGLHLVFARGSDKPRQEIKVRPGLDLIGKGYIIVEPSRHASGGVYTWEHDCEPVPVPDPVRALRRLQPAPPVVSPFDRARAYLARIPGAVSGESGHTQTFMAATALVVGFALDEGEALALLMSDYNPRCDPPWTERELVHKVSSALKQSRRERGYLLHTTAEVRSASPGVSAPAESRYPEGLLRSSSGAARRGYHNTALYVTGHPQWAGRWTFDEMTLQPMLDGQVPAATVVGEIRSAAEAMLGYSPPVGDVESAILAAAMKRPYHPVRRYLRSLSWDGIPRLSQVARVEMMSTTPVASAMVRKWAIGSVARAMDPGCKVDTCLVLQGTQGIMKSSFFSTMGGEWFSDTYVDMSNKDSYAQIAAAWIYELGEIDQVLAGRNEERFKGWLASTHDTYRAPYDRVAKKHPRGCVVVGTANPEEFLRDPTGNRRYWIVRVGGKIDVKLIASLRDQLWAEATCAYDAGETWWLDDRQELEREASNENHHEHDPWEEIVGAALSRPDGPSRVMVSYILSDVLRIDIAQQGRKEQMRAARILRWAGWRRRRSTSSWFYEAPVDGPRWPTRETYERDQN